MIPLEAAPRAYGARGLLKNDAREARKSNGRLQAVTRLSALGSRRREPRAESRYSRNDRNSIPRLVLYVEIQPGSPAAPEIEQRLAGGWSVILVRVVVERHRLPHPLQRMEETD